jgi:ABC-type transporter Mla subunit MlaD
MTAMCLGCVQRDVYKKLDISPRPAMSALPRSAAILAFPERDDDRLRRALRGLVAALAAQSEAVAGLRSELQNLSGAVDGLEGSLVDYRAELGTTGAALRQAAAGAQQLERSADGLLAATRP